MPLTLCHLRDDVGQVAFAVQRILASHEINEAQSVLASNEEILRPAGTNSYGNYAGASDRVLALVEGVSISATVVAEVEGSGRHLSL